MLTRARARRPSGRWRARPTCSAPTSGRCRRGRGRARPGDGAERDAAPGRAAGRAAARGPAACGAGRRARRGELSRGPRGGGRWRCSGARRRGALSLPGGVEARGRYGRAARWAARSAAPRPRPPRCASPGRAGTRCRRAATACRRRPARRRSSRGRSSCARRRPGDRFRPGGRRRARSSRPGSSTGRCRESGGTAAGGGPGVDRAGPSGAGRPRQEAGPRRRGAWRSGSRTGSPAVGRTAKGVRGCYKSGMSGRPPGRLGCGWNSRSAPAVSTGDVPRKGK